MEVSYLAKKISVTEAVSKALRVGLGGVLTSSDMCISHDNSGDPQIDISDHVVGDFFPVYKNYKLEIYYCICSLIS